MVVAAGVDAVGFVLAKSPRRVSLEKLKDLTALVPPPVARVGVFVDPGWQEVEQALSCGLDWVQFHGHETVEFCAQFESRVVKAIRVRTPQDLEVSSFQEVVSAFLFDAYHPDQAGGTGRSFNWEWLRGRSFSRPFFLSGGLNPENISQAISEVGPWGIDLSSGVESAPGLKDKRLVERLMRKARTG